MGRMNIRELKKLRTVTLGSNYILDIPRYDILASPNYAHKFEF